MQTLLMKNTVVLQEGFQSMLNDFSPYRQRQSQEQFSEQNNIFPKLHRLHAPRYKLASIELLQTDSFSTYLVCQQKFPFPAGRLKATTKACEGQFITFIGVLEKGLELRALN